MTCKRGHTGPRNAKRECQECRRLKMRGKGSGRTPVAERAKVKRWADRYPWKKRARNALRRARRRGGACTCCTKELLDTVYLQCPAGFEVDHRVTLAEGGKHCVKNLQILTRAAHRAKSNDDLRRMNKVRVTLSRVA